MVNKSRTDFIMCHGLKNIKKYIDNNIARVKKLILKKIEKNDIIVVKGHSFGGLIAINAVESLLEDKEFNEKIVDKKIYVFTFGSIYVKSIDKPNIKYFHIMYDGDVALKFNNLIIPKFNMRWLGKINSEFFDKKTKVIWLNSGINKSENEWKIHNLYVSNHIDGIIKKYILASEI
jgi:hypothetical protein